MESRTTATQTVVCPTSRPKITRECNFDQFEIYIKSSNRTIVFKFTLPIHNWTRQSLH